MSRRAGIQIAAVTLAASLVSGCTLAPARYFATKLRLGIPSGAGASRKGGASKVPTSKAARSRNLAKMFTLPETSAAFTCYAVNVVSQDIPTSGSAYASSEGRSECTYPGVTSDLVKPDPNLDTTTVELDVPTGTSRIVQVIGINDTQICEAGGNFSDALNSSDSLVNNIYELGRTVQDIWEDTQLDIDDEYAPGNPVGPFACTDTTKYFVYAASYEPAHAVSVFSYDAGSGQPTPVPDSDIQADVGSTALVADPFGKFVYVAASGPTGSLTSYSVDSQTGLLTKAATVVAGTGPQSIAVDQAGNYIYVADPLTNQVMSFAINRDTGELSPADSVAVTGVRVVTVRPSGGSIYVTAATGADVPGTITNFIVDPAAGTLTLGDTLPVSDNPDTAYIRPQGDYLFVGQWSNAANAGLRAFDITSGLTEITDANRSYPYNADTDFTAATTDWSGTYLYAARGDGSGINRYMIDGSNGNLNYQGSDTYSSTYNSPMQLLMDNNGKFLLAADSGGQIITYSVDGGSGALTNTIETPVPAILVGIDMVKFNN